MKMIMISCNISVLNELLEILKQQEVFSYQVIREVTGELPKGDPRLNTAVWPSFNACIFAHVEEDRADTLKEALSDHNRNALNDNERVTASSWTLDDMVYE